MKMPRSAAGDLDIDENELALVYRARGIDESEALARSRRIIAREHRRGVRRSATGTIRAHAASSDHDVVGSDWTAAISSFLLFASGAIIPVLPWIFGLQGLTAILIALLLVGVALLATGTAVGILSGGPPLRRALRQLAIGFGAAAVTYALGLVFGVGAV